MQSKCTVTELSSYGASLLPLLLYCCHVEGFTPRATLVDVREPRR
jgi:hypothetical protein